MITYLLYKFKILREGNAIGNNRAVNLSILSKPVNFMDYKDEMITKMEAEKEVNLKAIQHAQESIDARNHVSYLDKLNIKRWEKENKEIEKNIEMLKK